VPHESRLTWIFKFPRCFLHRVAVKSAGFQTCVKQIFVVYQAVTNFIITIHWIFDIAKIRCCCLQRVDCGSFCSVATWTKRVLMFCYVPIIYPVL